MNCPHGAPTINANVVEHDDVQPPIYMLELKVKCGLCGRPFRFRGIPAGVSTIRPTAMPSGEEASLPMEIEA